MNHSPVEMSDKIICASEAVNAVKLVIYADHQQTSQSYDKIVYSA